MIAAFSVVLLAAGSAAAYGYWRLDHNIKTVDISSALDDGASASDSASVSASATMPGSTAATGSMNILVLGSDTRSGSNSAVVHDHAASGARSDTAMVVHINASHTKATVVSIPRDTLVYRPSCTTASGATTYAVSGVMFNTAYSVGGPVCAIKTVQHLTGLKINHYIEVDFSGLAKLVDALGGVTVSQNIDDSYSHLKLSKGTHTLNGTQAVAFARTRHGIGDGSDLGRITLQQQLVKQMLKKIRSLNAFTDPTELYSLAETATQSLTVDTKLGSLSKLVNFAVGLDKIKTSDVTTVTMPVAAAPSDPNRLVATSAATKLWASLDT
nr:LCP family protein [Streptomyces sp. 846.5]